MARIGVTLCSLFALVFLVAASYATHVSYDERALTIDGQRRLIVSGSIHYPRSTAEMWPDLIKKAKDGGLNTIETYVFWNAHEPLRRQYDFSGNLDLVRFIKTVHDAGMYAIVRIGPYVCAEWNFGGLPVWLTNIPNMHLRTNNDAFKNEMQNFTTLIVDKLKHEKLFASQGGPIIVAQIENEYGNVQGSYGDDGKKYIEWCANLAQSYNADVPWIMCQQGDAPESMINTCNGYYCDQFQPNRNVPKMWTENWTGWFKSWGMKDPHRTAEDVAFAVARFYQLGGTLQNYYMYHGGTNFGRDAGGPYISTTYDYDAPLDEYGNLNQPKWGHLKKLHEVLYAMEKTITYGEREDTDYGNLLSATVYSYEGKSSCFFSNVATEEQKLTYDNTEYTVPGWSVSILPDCFKEIYNTAKVNTQTSVMVKKGNEADDEEEPYSLKWTWRPESFMNLDTALALGNPLTTTELLDQKFFNDTSDYLWYLTSVEMQETDPLWGLDTMLHVHTDGHIVHAFLNGKHIGSKYSQDGKNHFIFDTKANLKRGTNEIVLLSVTAGLANYGAKFEETRTGIHGPVRLFAIKNDEEITKVLDNSKWVYHVGLHGEDEGLYLPGANPKRHWESENLPSNKMFVWYKTTFKAPLGTDPVVVDLLGLGKGLAWVNGKSIGRYWPSYLASENGCDDVHKCDYRGSYYADKCVTNCGKSSQQWYHIPREFLNEDDNEFVLFEELGGTPLLVNFKTVTVGSICANANEGVNLELSCQGDRVISDIKFASFGEPTGICGEFLKGSCESPNTLSVLRNLCLGKGSCAVNVTEDTFGPTGCKCGPYKLAVEAVC
ncbi:beta-galactosidase 15-like [Tripterygium wilfordii]|uniref:beta-galactosidase 15-like n=1 Tax=Tripterygium wilfordii TaxID=458696 RepID=UPI0018F85A98|nr:beta-galactosidase 15-like [Tripterygium wilfordii]